MKPSRKLTTLGCLLALVGLAGCVWDGGMYPRDRDDARRDRHGQVPNSYQRDRDGRPCTGDRGAQGEERRDHDGNREQHDQDCHLGEH